MFVKDGKIWEWQGDDLLEIVPKVSEDTLLDAFRYFKGGRVNLGVKSPWWAKYTIPEGDEVKMREWIPNSVEIAFYELLLLDLILMMTEHDRRLIFVRCGRGYRISYRKCGREFGISYELFRKHFQLVIKKLQNALDKRIKKS